MGKPDFMMSGKGYTRTLQGKLDFMVLGFVANLTSLRKQRPSNKA
jgi:hypothetical protein